MGARSRACSSGEDRLNRLLLERPEGRHPGCSRCGAGGPGEGTRAHAASSGRPLEFELDVVGLLRRPGGPLLRVSSVSPQSARSVGAGRSRGTGPPGRGRQPRASSGRRRGATPTRRPSPPGRPGPGRRRRLIDEARTRPEGSGGEDVADPAPDLRQPSSRTRQTDLGRPRVVETRVGRKSTWSRWASGGSRCRPWGPSKNAGVPVTQVQAGEAAGIHLVDQLAERVQPSSRTSERTRCRVSTSSRTTRRPDSPSPAGRRAAPVGSRAPRSGPRLPAPRRRASRRPPRGAARRAKRAALRRLPRPLAHRPR